MNPSKTNIPEKSKRVNITYKLSVITDIIDVMYEIVLAAGVIAM